MNAIEVNRSFAVTALAATHAGIIIPSELVKFENTEEKIPSVLHLKSNYCAETELGAPLGWTHL